MVCKSQAWWVLLRCSNHERLHGLYHECIVKFDIVIMSVLWKKKKIKINVFCFWCRPSRTVIFFLINPFLQEHGLWAIRIYSCNHWLVDMNTWNSMTFVRLNPTMYITVKTVSISQKSKPLNKRINFPILTVDEKMISFLLGKQK